MLTVAVPVLFIPAAMGDVVSHHGLELLMPVVTVWQALGVIVLTMGCCCFAGAFACALKDLKNDYTTGFQWISICCSTLFFFLPYLFIFTDFISTDPADISDTEFLLLTMAGFVCELILVFAITRDDIKNKAIKGHWLTFELLLISAIYLSTLSVRFCATRYVTTFPTLLIIVFLYEIVTFILFMILQYLHRKKHHIAVVIALAICGVLCILCALYFTSIIFKQQEERESIRQQLYEVERLRSLRGGEQQIPERPSSPNLLKLPEQDNWGPTGESTW